MTAHLGAYVLHRVRIPYTVQPAMDFGLVWTQASKVTPITLFTIAEILSATANVKFKVRRIREGYVNLGTVHSAYLVQIFVYA